MGIKDASQDQLGLCSSNWLQQPTWGVSVHGPVITDPVGCIPLRWKLNSVPRETLKVFSDRAVMLQRDDRACHALADMACPHVCLTYNIDSLVLSNNCNGECKHCIFPASIIAL